MSKPSSKRVVFDTNALFHFQVRILVQHLSEAGALTPLWSRRTVEELRGVLRARGRDDAEAFLARWSDSVVAAHDAGQDIPMHTAFRDPGDMHVIEAALAAKAPLIVTDNARDFPRRHLLPLGLERVGVDAFFASQVCDLQGLEEWGVSGQDLRRAGLSRTAKQFSV